ncbi:ROK family transcriptional regulator [Streptomyces sp. RFCAC02]|uniref:ROK family transcriptional regulator n=1 Tax=Streptomyces sp. RFCAC02 TaxID=2499143 RepID=UPI00102286F8|nr:ROK family transcriptional regulator [Streptomyces sp. RFCAC02]
MKRTSRDIRTANRHRILRQVIAESPVSRPRLARGSGLSLATVATLVGELLDLGLLVEAGHEDSGGGRPRGLVAVNPRGGALVGVDLTDTHVHVEVVDTALRVLARARAPYRPAGRAPAEAAREVARVMRAAVARAGRVRVLGAGIGVPGSVERDGGVLVHAPAWGWHHVPLLALLREHVPYRLYLDSPLRTCVVAELWWGAAREVDDAVVVSLGTCVGAGLALGGTPYRGAGGGAGEWGHTTLVPEGRPCRCGRLGCVEAYAGASGIVRSLRERAPDSAPVRAGDPASALGALAEACAAGDPWARHVVAHTAGLLGSAITDLVNLLDPGLVVLTGWVSRALGTALLDPVRETVARYALPRAGPGGTGVVLSRVPANPVSLGAAALALEGLLGGVPAVASARAVSAAHSAR